MGAWLGLTPRRWQSGKTDIAGRLTKAGMPACAGCASGLPPFRPGAHPVAARGLGPADREGDLHEEGHRCRQPEACHDPVGHVEDRQQIGDLSGPRRGIGSRQAIRPPGRRARPPRSRNTVCCAGRAKRRAAVQPVRISPSPLADLPLTRTGPTSRTGPAMARERPIRRSAPGSGGSRRCRTSPRRPRARSRPERIGTERAASSPRRRGRSGKVAGTGRRRSISSRKSRNGCRSR
ncbi:hypothetical protein [Mangrovicoccus ximenensis]|uniref:hypothetical protein n=1 Tax=Mangrovicoccus ximenensis TaxID=1911570 RepID=UPI0038B2ED48